MKDYYFCYSLELHKYLREQGFRYICKGRHPESLRIFTLYEVTPEFTEKLAEYTNMGNQNDTGDSNARLLQSHL